MVGMKKSECIKSVEFDDELSLGYAWMGGILGFLVYYNWMEHWKNRFSEENNEFLP